MNMAFKRQRERKRTLENTYKDNISITTGLKMQGELVCISGKCVRKFRKVGRRVPGLITVRFTRMLISADRKETLVSQLGPS